MPTASPGNPNVLFFRRMLDVSTCHITLKDDNLLKQLADDSVYNRTGVSLDGYLESEELKNCPIMVEHKDQGYFVWEPCPYLTVDKFNFAVAKYIPGMVWEQYQCGNENCSTTYYRRDAMSKAGFSQAFIELLILAEKCGGGLWLDADGPVYEFLPKFDW